jgi:Amt family ammonium transporter
MRVSKRRLMGTVLPGALLFGGAALAQEAGSFDALVAAKEEATLNLNIVWTCLAAFLVFFMQAGFAMVEAGFTRAKNAINIMMKNLMDFSIGTLAFFLVGFGLMFGVTKGLVGSSLFGFAGIDPASRWATTSRIAGSTLR